MNRIFKAYYNNIHSCREGCPLGIVVWYALVILHVPQMVQMFPSAPCPGPGATAADTRAFCYLQRTASVVWWSQLLAIDPEVPGSIPGATTFSEKQWVWNGVHSAS
jgi:hypothetical protein